MKGLISPRSRRKKVTRVKVEVDHRKKTIGGRDGRERDPSGA